MAYLEEHLFVRRSTLPGAGKGLFTARSIRKGERIIEYRGVIRKRKVIANMPYTFVVKPDYLIDAKGYKDGIAHFANDATGTGRLERAANNCRYDRDGLRVFIQATKKIPAGAELLVFYGAGYWEEEEAENGNDQNSGSLTHKTYNMAKAKKAAKKAAPKKAMKKSAPKKAAKKSAKKTAKKAVKKAAPKKAAKKAAPKRAAKKAAPKKAAKKAARRKVKPSTKGKSGKSGG